MFGIGFSELIIVALVCVIFIKPDDLPAFFRKLGRLFAQVRKAYKEVTAVKDDFMREMDIAAAIQDADKAKAAEAKAKPVESAPVTAELATAEPAGASSEDAPRDDEIKVEE